MDTWVFQYLVYRFSSSWQKVKDNCFHIAYMLSQSRPLKAALRCSSQPSIHTLHLILYSLETSALEHLDQHALTNGANHRNLLYHLSQTKTEAHFWRFCLHKAHFSVSDATISAMNTSFFLSFNLGDIRRKTSVNSNCQVMLEIFNWMKVWILTFPF